MNLQERLHGKNMRHIARVAGFHPSTISEAAKGRSKPTPETVKCILEALQRIEGDPTLKAMRVGRPKAVPPPPVPPQVKLAQLVRRMVDRYKGTRYRGNNTQWEALERFVKQVEQSNG